MRLTTATLFLLFYAATPLFAQHLLRGIVIDANSGNPLPSVNVFLKNNQARGVLTNDNGEYQIKLTDEELKDNIVFSLLSYKTHTEPLWPLDTANLSFNLQMETSFVSLDEVVVISDLGLRQLVSRCLDNVASAYGQDDYLLRAYVRIYDIDTDTFSRQVEAQLNIRDTKWPIPRYPRGQRYKEAAKAKISQFRKPDFDGYSLRNRWKVLNGQYKLLGGYNGWTNKLRTGRTLMLHDPSGAEPLDGLTFSNRGEYLNGQDTLVKIYYRISDEEIARRNIPTSSVGYFYSGELLVNKSDLAILKITEGMAGEEKFYRSATYQKVDGKYYVKELRDVMAFDYDYNTHTYYSNSVLYVNEVITESKAIKAAFKGKTLDPSLEIKDVRVKYDAEYWDNNSMLQLVSAPEVMRANMRRMQELKSGKKKE